MTIRLKLDGGIFDAESQQERTVSRIEAWYDRHCRDWVIELQDDNGYEVENCIRVYSKREKDETVKELKAKYGIR